VKETDLAERVIVWLEADGWDVYQEVQGIDIVATNVGIVWAIECKLSFGLAVIEQADRNLYRAHYSSVAVPPVRRSGFAYTICAQRGIGVLAVRNNVYEQHSPKLNRHAHKAAVRLRGLLAPEHKTYAKAGSPSGGGWTSYKSTMKVVREIVTAKPGIGTGELLGILGSRHHYGSTATARSVIPARLESVEEWCEVRRVGRLKTYWPAGSPCASALLREE
jgi:hypothetical protein